MSIATTLASWLLWLPLWTDADTSRRAPEYPDHANLLVVRDGEGLEHPVRGPADWAVRRAHILAHVQEVMGPLPGGGRRVPLDLQVVEEIDEPTFVRKRITYAVEPGDRVHAWLLIPRDGRARHPAALALHPTTPLGKGEPVGLGTRPGRQFGKELAERGYVVLAPDYPKFGDYQVDPYALGYASASMKGIWNHMRGVDLLCSLPEVDPSRVAAIGHSLGGHNAIFVALFDERIKAVVSSCGFTAFPSYYDGDIRGWSHQGYMPRLESVYHLEVKRVPFDFPELVGAIAPRAFFASAPTEDDNFDVKGVRACIASARGIYRLLGAEDQLRVVYPEAPHDFPTESRTSAYEFLDEALGPGSAGS